VVHVSQLKKHIPLAVQAVEDISLASTEQQSGVQPLCILDSIFVPSAGATQHKLQV
jgi:hypothetical protein